MEHKPEIVFPNLGLVIDKLPQVAFKLFGYDIYWYAVIMVTAIFSGWLLARWQAKKTGQNPEVYNTALSLGIVLSFSLGRLYYMVFANVPLRDFYRFRDGGLGFYGAFLGIVLAGYLTSKIHKTPMLVLLDTCIPSVLLGQVIGRMGNFFNREAYGSATDGLFAMRVLATQAKAGVSKVVVDSAGYIQVHPTFLYEAGANLVWLLLLVFYVRPRVKFTGEMVCWYLLGYGVIRFFVEGLRTDQLMLGAIPVSQLVAVVSVVVSMAVLVRLRKGVNIRG